MCGYGCEHGSGGENGHAEDSGYVDTIVDARPTRAQLVGSLLERQIQVRGEVPAT